jgi:hypothetical protein
MWWTGDPEREPEQAAPDWAELAAAAPAERFSLAELPELHDRARQTEQPVDLDEATAAMPAVPAQRAAAPVVAPAAPLFAPQRAVQPAAAVNVVDLVQSDLRGREAAGVREYGAPLSTATDIDGLTYAYEEVLDLACYLRKVLAERDGRRLAPAAPAVDPWAVPVPDYRTAGDYRDARTALGWSVARATDARDAAVEARALAEEARAVAARTELKVDEQRLLLDGLVAAVASAQTTGASSAAGSPDPVGIGAAPAPAVGRGQALVDVELLAEHLADVVADAIARRMNGECCG